MIVLNGAYFSAIYVGINWEKGDLSKSRSWVRDLGFKRERSRERERRERWRR